jgi:hypothetical protein
MYSTCTQTVPTKEPAAHTTHSTICTAPVHKPYQQVSQQHIPHTARYVQHLYTNRTNKLANRAEHTAQYVQHLYTNRTNKLANRTEHPHTPCQGSPPSSSKLLRLLPAGWSHHDTLPPCKESSHGSHQIASCPLMSLARGIRKKKKEKSDCETISSEHR